MKEFLGSLAALVIITAVAAFALQTIDMSAKQVYTTQTGSVRH